MLNAHLSADGKGKKNSRLASGETKNFTTYPQVAMFLLKKYATDEVIVETESDITRSAQSSHMTPSQYAEVLVTKAFWCGDVYEEYAPIQIFIEGLVASVRHSMREYWENKKDANLHDPALHTTSLLRLQVHDVTSK